MVAGLSAAVFPKHVSRQGSKPDDFEMTQALMEAGIDEADARYFLRWLRQKVELVIPGTRELCELTSTEHQHEDILAALFQGRPGNSWRYAKQNIELGLGAQLSCQVTTSSDMVSIKIDRRWP